MNEILIDLQEKHREKLDELIHLYRYRFHRYGLEFALLFFYMEEDIDISSYESFIRLTDSFLKLEDNFYAIVYQDADIEKSSKAAHNIIKHFKQEHGERLIYISAISIKEKFEKKDMVNQLFMRLKKGISAKISSKILTE